MMKLPTARPSTRATSRRGRAPAAWLVLALVTVLGSGCSFSWDSEGISDVFFGNTPASEIAAGEEPAEVPAPREEDTGTHDESALRRIAILPTAYTDGTAGQPCDLCPDSVVMKATDAKSARLITGFVYEAIARHPRFLFPTARAVENAVAARPDRSLAAAAASLAESGRADVVVVFALVELRPRVGPDDAPETPAGAAVYASLVDARSGASLWSDTFDRDEQARGRVIGVYDKIINDAPVRWKTAEEFSEIAVDDLVEDLVDELD